MAYVLATLPGGGAPIRYDLDASEPLTIGRSPENRLTGGGNGLSRRHAVLTYLDDLGVIRDLGSSNGTFVNGEEIRRPVILMDGDIIVCGELKLEYHER